MGIMNGRLSEQIGVATHLAPSVSRAAGSYVTPAVDASQWHQFVALLQIGTLDGSATVKAKWQHNSTSVSSDSNWADVDATNCITSTFTSTSNGKIGQLELMIHQNPSLSQFVRVLVSTATSTWTGACLVEAVPKYLPATDVDSSDIVQTIVF